MLCDWWTLQDDVVHGLMCSAADVGVSSPALRCFVIGGPCRTMLFMAWLEVGSVFLVNCQSPYFVRQPFNRYFYACETCPNVIDMLGLFREGVLCEKETMCLTSFRLVWIDEESARISHADVNEAGCVACVPPLITVNIAHFCR